MTLTASAQNPGKKSLFATILIAWLIVGSLDLSCAAIQTLIYNAKPVKMLQYIASGVFGKEAFSTEMPYAVYGFIFHYCIALIWTVLFFLVYPQIKFLSKNKIVTGIIYGIFIWTMMTRVVLPLSNTAAGTFKLKNAIIAASILSLAIGIPLSFMAYRYYYRK
jgi:hypothetical protein